MIEKIANGRGCPGKGRFYAIATVIYLLDQGTKFLIVQTLPLYDSRAVLPFFNIVYVRNIGSAFGLFKGLGNGTFIVLSVVALVLIAALIMISEKDLYAFSLLLGGAAGNATDRVARAYVVDFLDLYVGRYHWPAFNVADSALTVGITILIISQFRAKT
ncbi:signal peptidase II [Candidatus Magnetobacterium casense]|uniref:signal peptidase II n=1 Tax=Candidatus Magnetobacterium casense TaxID=1455061 RepID=UPI000AF1B8B1|nr:signal peptidase II [Candidatus Magnetobacterium casensis]